ncbi:MAG: transposase [Verrucomicrobiaceae bacterium]|nr:transposase [Verrucomicrobiaceae bacterium]
MPKYFNPREEIHAHHGHLPHWRQEGTMYFITSRLADSMPQEKLREWHQQRENWLQSHGIADITQLDSLSETERHEFHTVFTAKWHDWLDQGRGECHLRLTHLRELLIQRLFATQEPSCELDAWVIMPNHLHALVTPTGKTLGEVVRVWKGGSASDINKALNRTGTLWQAEPYDHIVRSEAQTQHYRRYIAENPIKAGLKEGEYACGLGKVVWASAQAFKAHIDQLNQQGR